MIQEERANYYKLYHPNFFVLYPNFCILFINKNEFF